VAGEIDPVRVVDDAIENGVSVGGIADQLMPFVDWDLAGDDRGSPTVAFFEDFEEVVRVREDAARRRSPQRHACGRRSNRQALASRSPRRR
jgi:hypothetical protein